MLTNFKLVYGDDANKVFLINKAKKEVTMIQNSGFGLDK